MDGAAAIWLSTIYGITGTSEQEQEIGMTFRRHHLPSQGVTCSAWHFAARATPSPVPAGRPVVVMAHGFGGTKDAGLHRSPSGSARRASMCWPSTSAGSAHRKVNHASRFRSSGRSRTTTPPSTRRSHCPVSTATRLAIWGSSLSGGHVFHVAADRTDVAAVIAMTPLTSGLAASRASAGSRGVGTALRWTAAGVASRIAWPAAVPPS